MFVTRWQNVVHTLLLAQQKPYSAKCACASTVMHCCRCLPPCPPAAPAGGDEAAAGARAGAADPGVLVVRFHTAEFMSQQVLSPITGDGR